MEDDYHYDEDFTEYKPKSEWDEWTESDDIRRNEEKEFNNRSTY